jgi:protein-tyrosine phosphatase
MHREPRPIELPAIRGDVVPRDHVLEVVFVCTGNRARSPLAEALFRRYSAGVETAVSSSGTLNVGALAPLERAIEAGDRLGVDLREHRARPIRNGALASADLVLGFEPSHVAAAVGLGGASAEQTFLLGELVMLLGGSSWEQDPVARARAEISQADARRVRPFPHASEVVIADPLGKPAKVMRRTAAKIDRLVRQLVLGLYGELAHPLPLRRGG